MAPSVGHLHKLVARNVKLIKAAWKQAQARLTPALRSEGYLRAESIPIRAGGQPLHPLARIRQAKGRWFSSRTGARYFTSGRTATVNRAALPKSRTATAVAGLTGRTPFASTLRPNLTGGTLNRTAGGYSLGAGRVGGARYFSHSPAAPAEVIQNVSQAIRAFGLAGKKAQYDGLNSHGEKRYRAVTALQDETSRKMKKLPKATPGSYIDFKVNPTITALTPLSAVAGYAQNAHLATSHATLNTDGLIDILSVDFSRALKDLTVILNDIKCLSSLGDLPITYSSDSTLRIYFPGCDAQTVEQLCEEMGVRRGLVFQDEEYDAFVGTDIALLFPFAPSRADSADSIEDEAQSPSPASRKIRSDYGAQILWQDMLESKDDYSTRSEDSQGLYEHVSEVIRDVESNPWRSNSSALDDQYAGTQSSPFTESHHPSDPLEYHEFEGIYRFVEMCDRPRR